jgi:hypothetical protein
MKLDRNITNPRRGKYALIKLRESRLTPELCCGPDEIMVETNAIDFGDTDDSDFFVIRLKDKFSGGALRGYANAITDHLATLHSDDPSRDGLVEYHHEIIALAEQAHRTPNKRIPD